jgi:hypothetical protein
VSLSASLKGPTSYVNCFFKFPVHYSQKVKRSHTNGECSTFILLTNGLSFPVQKMSQTGHKVVNRTRETVFCAITNKTNPSGNAGWFEIQPGGSEIWNRSGWEDVQFKDRNNSRKTALWINRGGPAIVNFDGFDKELTIENDYKPEPQFNVSNKSDKSMFCAISTTSGGNNAWFKLMPGESERWRRSGWETVMFRNQEDTERKGIYVNTGDTRVSLDFLGFDKDVVIHDPPANFILDEHLEEAMRIADRSFNNQDTRASLPGGLTASPYKCETLEFLTTGLLVLVLFILFHLSNSCRLAGIKKDLNNHNQIYTLALLINHLKYGLAEPALVVSVSPSWVKVAAYTAEFDSVVILGFPTAAIDLVAPNKKRPEVGTRLLVVSQFSYRDAQHQGVQSDITVGPMSYSACCDNLLLKDFWVSNHTP